MRSTHPLPRDRRGSVLIVALILTAIIAIGLGAYLQLGQTALRLSHGNFHRLLALNLATSAIEDALWEANHGSWTGWTAHGEGDRHRSRTFSHPDVAPGVEGTVKVFVTNAESRRPAYPVVFARAVITTQSGSAVERWFKVDLKKRSLFGNGLLAGEALHFMSVYASVDSYDSRKGNFNERLKDGTRNREARGRVAGKRIVASGVEVASRNVFGFIAAGSKMGLPDLSLDPKATVSGDLEAEPGMIAADRISPTFVSALADCAAPAVEGIGIGSITQSLTLPRRGDTPGPDGRYHYDVEAIVLSGALQHLTIRGNVAIRIRAPFTEAITVTGLNSGIIIAPYARLNLYVSTDVTLAGGGVANNNPPGHFVLWGTRTSDNVTPQRIRLRGNGHLNVAVYAPNAELTIHGGGEGGGTVRGALVGKTISFNADDFHYDEALLDQDFGEPLGLGMWDELATPDERAPYASNLL